MSILKIKGVTRRQLLYMDNGLFIVLCIVSIELKSLIFSQFHTLLDHLVKIHDMHPSSLNRNLTNLLQG